MNENNFDNGKRQVKESIRYWKRYWIHYANLLCKSNDYNVTINSPHSLIDNIISEIEYNDLKNKENRALFKKQLGEWLKNDKVFSSLFGNKVSLLIARFEDTSCVQYLLLLCKQIKNELETGKYLDSLLDYLASVIDDTTFLNYENKTVINRYTELIIAEFIAVGFVAEDLKGIINDFEAFGIADFNIKDYENEEAYQKAITEYYEGRTIFQEIASIKKYYTIEPIRCLVLIRLDGIKGEIDTYIDDVNIYSPFLKQYIVDSNSLCDVEKISEERKYVNVAIPVGYKMPHSSFTYAIDKLESIIDILELTYNNSKPIRYDKHKLCIVDEDGYVKTGYISIDELEYDESDYIVSETSGSKIPKNQKNNLNYEAHRDYMLSLDVSNKKDDFELIGKRIVTLNKSTKLSRAAHWYQKGKNTESLEDKLLFHWIAIESLLKSSMETYHNIIIGDKDVSLLKIVQKLSSAVMVTRYFRRFYIDMHKSFYVLTKYYNNYLNIPADLQDRIFPKDDEDGGFKKYFCNFLNILDELEENINDELYKNNLRELALFYKNGNGIKTKEQEISNDILLIYRLRNLIAHNAIFPKYLIKYYANKIEIISGCVIKLLIEKYRKTNWSLDDILIDVSIKYEDFKSTIDERIKYLKQAT